MNDLTTKLAELQGVIAKGGITRLSDSETVRQAIEALREYDASKAQPVQDLPLTQDEIDGIYAKHSGDGGPTAICELFAPALIRAALAATPAAAEPVKAANILDKLTRHDWRSAGIWRHYYPSATGDWVDLRELRKLLEDSAPVALAATPAPAPQPLTDERLRQMHHEDEFGLYCDDADFLDIARSVESECARAWGVKLAVQGREANHG